MVRETYGDYVLDFFYDQNGHPFMLLQNGNIYYYITNAQGDVIRLVDINGNTAASYRYDPYGKATSALGSHANINPLRYRGYVYDVETGLYYLQSRYYDPEVGRFINSDTFMATGSGLIGNNMFAYCLNNPVSMADNNGQDAIVVVEFKLDENGLPIVGHISVYIQDSQGNWYVTQFNGSNPSNARIYVDPADEEMLKKMLCGDEIPGKVYEYFIGDFSESYTYATTLVGTNCGGYKFFKNNCADFAHDVLLKGKFSDENLTAYLEKREPLIPIVYLKRLQFRETLTKVKQLVKEVTNCVEAYYS